MKTSAQFILLGSILAILAVSVLVVPGLAFALVPESGAEEIASSFSSASDSADSVARRDIFDLLDEYVLGRRADPSLGFTDHTGLEWAFVPTFSYNPVYGAAFGALASGAGRRGSTDARYSSLAISGNYTTRKQVQLQLRGDLFDRSEAYLLKSD